MLKVGLTGGIGSGKTTVAKIFEGLGVPVFYADNASKTLMSTNESIKAAIIRAFGEQAYVEGQPNRQYLASQVFKDPEKLAALNAILHPATIQYGKDWMAKQSSAYAIKEAAIIFETGTNKELDFIIGVDAPEEVRMERVMLRDGVTRQQVKERMLRQMDASEKMKMCDFVITNDDKKEIIPQVLEVHQILLGMSNNAAKASKH